MSESKVPEHPAPELIEKLFQTIIGPLGATHIGDLLIEPDHIEERVLLLTQTFERYPEYKAPFAQLVKTLHGGKQQGTISLDEQIRFFQTKHTRYWLLVNLINRVLKIKELQLDFDSGRLPARAHDLLKYSHKARDTFGEESRFKDLVFASGLMFDFLFYLQRSTYLSIGQTRYDDYLNQCFVRASDQGLKIVGLSKFKKVLALQKLVPATAFMRQLAQMSMVLIKMTEAVDLYKKLDGIKPSEPLRMAMEMKQFQAHTGMVACYLAETFPVFEQLGDVMSVWGFPYLSQVEGRTAIHDAAGLGMLGVSIAERGLAAEAFAPSGKPLVEMAELRYLDFEITKEVRSEIKI